ncbi:MAG: hypothetical protein KDJ26_03160 [Alphaproteobacteria bacterium]|nr:hypothetical protein [Alphaproteobacteria bacterium]MCB9984195.1 hypothetical protein [Micavibrio sp.]
MSKNGWTQERRLRQSEAIKRWKPWEKSTGAKTKEGKEHSKMNAYKHGARSDCIMKLAGILELT